MGDIKKPNVDDNQGAKAGTSTANDSENGNQQENNQSEQDNQNMENPDDPDSSDDDTNDGDSSEWDDLFPGKTPDEVKDELKSWVEHSRKWEKRARDWKKQVENGTANKPDSELNAKFNEVQSENLMFRDLIALEIEHGKSVNISDLADSIAFRDAYRALDRDADDFADKLQTIVEKRTPAQRFPNPRNHEIHAPESTGKDLYDRLFNKNEGVQA